MNNRAFSRSMRILSQPITFGIFLLLLLNDLLFKILWPSWLTGKLSDFAWLYLATICLALVISWLVPAHLKRQERLVGLVSFGLVGLVFALVKIFPPARDVLVSLWQNTTGIPVRIVVDPGDLLALTALLACGLLWVRQSPVYKKPASLNAPVRPDAALGWLALPLLALLTIADAAMPDYGIKCLAVQDGSIHATSAYSTYTSSDGGATWQDSELNSYGNCQTTLQPGEAVTLNGQNLQYKFTTGSMIQRSSDSGQTWTNDYKLTGNQQAQSAYYEKVETGNAIVTPGPLDAVVDPKTNNVVFAMGHEGVLVRFSDGNWRWVAVGQYRHVDLSASFQPVLVLLTGEIILAICLGLQLINTWMLRPRLGMLRWFQAIIGWVLWLGCGILVPPALTTSYTAMISGGLLIVICILVVPFAIENGVYLARRSGKDLARSLLLALAGGVLFLLPFFLWVLDRVPTYSLALAFGAILGAIIGIVGYFSHSSALARS